MSDNNSIISYVAIAVASVSSIFGIINHKRVRSSCCGAKMEVSLDVENTTPVNGKKLLSSTEPDVSPGSDSVVSKDADTAK